LKKRDNELFSHLSLPLSTAFEGLTIAQKCHLGGNDFSLATEGRMIQKMKEGRKKSLEAFTRDDDEARAGAN